MPYIPQNRRDEILETGLVLTSGELNWKISNAISAYLDTRGLSYNTINDIIGALEGAKLEFYRRVAVPYEEEKLTQNGDVYDV